MRTQVPLGAVVYSDQETSYRVAAYAPVYIAVAPPGHVASTEENRPFERAEDAREFLRTGDLAIPRRYGADYLVVDRLRSRRDFDLEELYRDPRFSLPAPRMPGFPPVTSVAAAAGRLDPEQVAGLEVDGRERAAARGRSGGCVPGGRRRRPRRRAGRARGAA